MADFAGAFGKLDRADHHLRDLEGAIRWWQQQDPYAIIGHRNTEKTEHRFHVSINFSFS